METFDSLMKKFGFNSPDEIVRLRRFYLEFPASNMKWGQMLVEEAEAIVRYEKTIQMLNEGKEVINREGGSSMVPIIDPYQPVVLSPIKDKSKLAKGDIVLAKVEGKYYLHKISAIKGSGKKKRYQISNNHGYVNGWTSASKIYGIVTEVLAKDQ